MPHAAVKARMADRGYLSRLQALAWTRQVIVYLFNGACRCGFQRGVLIGTLASLQFSPILGKFRTISIGETGATASVWRVLACAH